MSTDEGFSQSVEIVNKRGLHARASARLAKEAGRFGANITVCKSDTCVTATSIMGLMMLGAAKGTRLLCVPLAETLNKQSKILRS